MNGMPEDFVPYDRSAPWRLQDEYFARQGIAAWTGGDLPYFGLNNPVMARQHAWFLAGLIPALEAAGALGPDEPAALLEIGGGLGLFAANLLGALERLGLGPRVRYVLSDYVAKTVEEAIRTPELAPLVEAGRVLPALFDLRRPERLVDLQGRPIDLSFSAAFANYVCCAAPVKILRRTGGKTFEKHVRTEAEEERLETASRWVEVDLDMLFPRPWHAETLRPFHEATLAYPAAFLEMLLGLRPRMKHGGVMLVNDYGDSGLADPEAEPERFGGALAHAVDFRLFDAFCRATGLGLLRTRGALRSIQTAAVVYGGEPAPAVEQSFRRALVRRTDNEDMIDFTAAAEHLFDQGQFELAARLYRRCLRHAPDDAELAYRFGRCLVRMEAYGLAVKALRRGARLPGAQEYDFAAEIRRARRGLKASGGRGSGPGPA
jgi:tetratricopeptide (TPR) repeat protein